VWQQQTEFGWEIMYWDLVLQDPVALTENEVDDIAPKTDGRFVAWRRLEEGVWRVYLMDLQGSPIKALQLSTQGTTSDLDLKNGVVVWQEWVNTDWEIMLWRPEQGVQQMTYNTSADLSPYLLNNSVIWEGEDPSEKDREIFRIDFLTGQVSRVTDNSVDDDALRVSGQEILWFERRTDVSAEMKLKDGEVFPQILDIVSPPAPVVVETIVVPERIESSSIPESVPDPVPEL
jgi:hypothetical protein